MKSWSLAMETKPQLSIRIQLTNSTISTDSEELGELDDPNELDELGDRDEAQKPR